MIEKTIYPERPVKPYEMSMIQNEVILSDTIWNFEVMAETVTATFTDNEEKPEHEEVGEKLRDSTLFYLRLTQSDKKKTWERDVYTILNFIGDIGGL